MVRDALRTYLTMASGLVEVPRQQAMRVAKALVSQGETTAGQAGQVAEDLIGTSRANRDALLQLIRYEVDRGLGRLGLATAEEVRELTERVHTLEAQVRDLRKPAKTAAPKKSTAKKATRSPAKKASR
jgi:polyhydroxyalkanoate synthesis regulator phasin